MVTEAGVVNDTFGAREVGIIFNLSMMTSVDEITQDNHYMMNLAEF
jgi:hypothetical protein